MASLLVLARLSTSTSSSSSTSRAAAAAAAACLQCRNRIIPAAAQPAASMGTVASKDKNNKKKGGAAGEEGGGDASKNAWYIKMIDEPPGPLTSALPEETQARYQAIGHKYNVEYNRRAARHAGDLHRKVKLKLEAINALPVELQAEAKKMDFTPFPLARRITTHTPPIPGFEAGRYDLPGAI